MSQEKVESVRRGFDAFQEGDASQMLDLMADDLVTYRADPDGATYHGKEGFLRATADWTEDFIDAGDRVLVRVRQTARGAASGIPVEGEFWFLFEIRARRAAKVSFYVRRGDALEAAGLEEFPSLG